MEEKLNGRGPQWKMTSVEDNLNGRRPQWKTTYLSRLVHYGLFGQSPADGFVSI